MNKKSFLMIVLLTGGILTALTATGVSVAPAFAAKDECEDNDDDNCNETTHKIIQENNCKSVNESKKIGSLGNPLNDNRFTCTNGLDSPANGNDNIFDPIQPPNTTTDVFALIPSTLTP